MTFRTFFDYEGHRFALATERQPTGTFLARVAVADGADGQALRALPQDTKGYASEAEALRHAEQQAVRWAHDQSGDGQGRF